MRKKEIAQGGFILLDFIAHYGWIAIWPALFLEGVSFPFPGMFLLAFLGSLARAGRFALPPLLLLAFFGHVCGTLAAWAIARWVSPRTVDRLLKRLHVSAKHVAQARDAAQRYGILFYLFGRWLPWIGNLVPYVGGWSKTRFTSFALFSALSSAVSVLLWGIGGYLLGSQWQQLQPLLGRWGPWVALTAASIVGLILVRRRKRHLLPAPAPAQQPQPTQEPK